MTEQATSFFFSTFHFVRTQADRARIILLRVCVAPSFSVTLSTTKILSSPCAFDGKRFRFNCLRKLQILHATLHCSCKHHRQRNSMTSRGDRRNRGGVYTRRDRYRRRVVISSTLRKSYDTCRVVTTQVGINSGRAF